ncbi:MAG: hypothetical protein ABEI86_07295, partial [Halobacteriaceae archaeon]
ARARGLRSVPMETAKSTEIVLHLRRVPFHFLLIAAYSDSRLLAVPLLNRRWMVAQEVTE